MTYDEALKMLALHAGKALPTDLLIECARLNPWAALFHVGAALPSDLLIECARREPRTALEYVGDAIPAGVRAECERATADRVEIWYDDTSDSENPAWCVSLCAPNGEERTCLSTHDDRSDALAAACDEAIDRGLALYERSRYGDCEELAVEGE